MDDQDYQYPWHAKLLHMGMSVFGIAAYLTAESAEGGSGSAGYLLHAYLGLSLATFVLLRLLGGFAGSGPLRFSSWSPLRRLQWIMAFQDIHQLLRLRWPERGMHEGLAGLAQFFGLMLFAWMGLTGAALYFLGASESGALETIEEWHEVGETLIPLYLALHVGSVLVHTLTGHSNWRRIWTFRAGIR